MFHLHVNTTLLKIQLEKQLIPSKHTKRSQILNTAVKWMHTDVNYDR